MSDIGRRTFIAPRRGGHEQNLDAVVYGTVEGYARLGIPYMAHIRPRTAW